MPIRRRFYGLYYGIILTLLISVCACSNPTVDFNPTTDSVVRASQLVTVPSDFADPLEALKQTKDGGRLQFMPGKYILSKPLEITRNITVASTADDPKDVTLDAKHGAAIILRAANARIQGLMLQNQSAEFSPDGSVACALYIPEGVSEVVHCEITSKMRGIQVGGDSQTNPCVTHCKIYACGRVGVLVREGASGKFTECEIYDNINPCIETHGVGSYPTVEKCKIYGSMVRKTSAFMYTTELLASSSSTKFMKMSNRAWQYVTRGAIQRSNDAKCMVRKRVGAFMCIVELPESSQIAKCTQTKCLAWKYAV